MTEPGAEGPYKGLRSYETEDGHLFHGRQEATERILAKILSARTMVLHAPSAAGKTSLINARIIPGLETRGWMAVRIRPRDDPMASVRFDMVRQLLPSPQVEAIAIRRAHDALAVPGERLLIADLLSRFDALATRDERRRTLGAPVKIESRVPGPTKGDLVEVHPMFCRLLRGTIDVARFDEHLATICGQPLRTAIEVRAPALIAELESERSDNARAALVTELLSDAASESLTAFFETWWHTVARHQTQYGVVLCIDQFEELFTRFADPGPARANKSVLKWQVRERFFQELDALFRRPDTTDAPADKTKGAATPSLRLVISLRDEFVAQLDRVRPATERGDDGAFHLPLLTIEEAKEVIADPAREFGIEYDDRCFGDIITKLAQEQRYVEPAHLQIVCDRLWRACTQPLPADASPEEHRLSEARPPGTIDYDTYKALGMAEGILRRFFVDFLATNTPSEQLELLEMLELLITPAGTRNIADYAQLVNRRFRDTKRRAELLDRLKNATIVRAEWRHGTQFLELTHEFLIDPIRTAIKDQLHGTSDNARLLAARRALEHASLNDYRKDERILLSPGEIDTLLACSRDLELSRSKAMRRQSIAVAWDVSSAEVLLRSAVAAMDDDRAMAAKRLRECAGIYGLEAVRWRESLESDRDVTSEIGSHEVPVIKGPPLPMTDVVASYLKSPSVQVRHNAVRALALLADETSIRELVRLAVEGSDDARTVAEQELTALDGEPQAKAVAILAAATTLPATATRAYILLGKLSAAGAAVALPAMDFRARLRLASTPVAEKRAPWYKPWQWRRRWRAMRVSILGATVGVITTALFIAAVFNDEPGEALLTGFLPVLVFGLFVATPMLVLAASRRSEPIHLHADRSTAFSVEVRRAAYTAFIPLAPLYLLGHLHNPQFSRMAALTVAWILATAAVRAGTLIAFEAFVGRVANTRVIQMLVGGLCGGAVSAIGMLIIARTLHRPTGTDDVAGWATYRLQVAVYAKAWVAFLPAWFGLALAYAEPESGSRARAMWSPERAFRARRLMYAFAALVAFVIPTAIAARARAVGSRRFILQRWAIDERDGVPPDTSSPLVTLPASKAIDSLTLLPARFQFVVDPTEVAAAGDTTKHRVAIRLQLSGRDVRNQQALLRDTAGTVINFFDQSASVVPGRYFLEIGTHDDLSTEDFASELTTRMLRSVWLLPPRSNRPLDIAFALKRRDLSGTPWLAGVLADSALQLAMDPDSVRRAKNLTVARDLIDRAADILARLDSTSINSTSDKTLSLPGVSAGFMGPDGRSRKMWEILNQLCWAGATVGEAKTVLPYCDRAIGLDKNFYDVDSRGLARALVGDSQGAIEDFKSYIEESKQPDQSLPVDELTMERRRALRQRWIDALRNGETLNLEQLRADLSKVAQ